jgi:hypothetical protein
MLAELSLYYELIFFVLHVSRVRFEVFTVNICDKIFSGNQPCQC